jgi:glycosyltransferase involved in cell wall biosynthesis
MKNHREYRKKNILFILKERFYSPSKTSYGLINSAAHVATHLTKDHKYNCKIVSVVDSNNIDKEVHDFKADIVIIEALWVPTYKMRELLALSRHDHVKWVVRVHSDIGYLSAETQALKLVNEYRHIRSPRLIVAFNDRELTEVMSHAFNHKFTYLPNVIVTRHSKNDFIEERKHIDIGCFGAMRILKNQCFQALCSIKAADMLGKKLNFHVTPNLNSTNDPVLENLKQIFADSQHDLIIHDWMPNEDFQELVAKMDIGLQLSYTESFNIVTADFINNNRLIIVSDAIDWVSPSFKTSTTDYDKATRKIVLAYGHRNSEYYKNEQQRNLREHNEVAECIWKHFLNELLNEY